MADLNKFHPVFYDSFTSEWERLKNLWEIQRTKKLQLIGDEGVYWRNRISQGSAARPWINTYVYECFCLCTLTTHYEWFEDQLSCLKIQFASNIQSLKLTSLKSIHFYLIIWIKLLTFLGSFCFHLPRIFPLHVYVHAFILKIMRFL